MKKITFRSILEAIASFFKKYPVSACLSILGGILLIAFPEGVLGVLIRIIGIITILYAVLCVLALVADPEPIGGTLFGTLRLLSSLAVLAAGIVLTVDPLAALAFLVTVVGIYLLIDGCVKLYRLLMAQSAILSVYGIRPETERAKILLTVGYVLTVVAGFLLLFYPVGTAKTVALIAGIALTVEGAQSLCTYFSLRKAKAREEKEDNVFYAEGFIDKTK